MDMRKLFRPARTVPAARVKEKLNEKAVDDFVLLDVREPGEYAGGHLPGAMHIPLSELAGRIDELDKTRPVVTY